MTPSMFVCLSKTLTGSEVKYTVVLFSQNINKAFVLSKYKMFCLFLEKNDTFNIYHINFLELKMPAPSNHVNYLVVNILVR